MKIIPKFQGGGGFESLFTTYVPVQAPQQTESVLTSQSERSSRLDSDDNKGKITEKDLLTMLKDIDGLPNEMLSIVTNLLNTFNISKLTGIELDDLSSLYLRNLYKIPQIVNNKKQYDLAYNRAIENGTMSELAITPDGRLVVLDIEGNIHNISLKEFIDNRDLYRGLTVSNLLNMRAFSPSLANNVTMFDTVNSSMGYLFFLKLIKEAVTTLGSSKITRGMLSSEGELASKGLDVLTLLKDSDLVQPGTSIDSDSLYKYKIIDKNLKKLIDYLTSYISALLPESAKVWAALKLGTSDREKATASLITTYLSSGENTTNEILIEPKSTDKGATGGSKSGSKSSTDEPDMTFLTALQNGYGGSYERRKYNPGGNGAFYVTGSSYGAFLNLKGDVISDVTLLGLLTLTGLAGITNPNSITFGDNLIKPNLLPLIAIQNTGGVYTILPCKRNGTQVTPDFELMGAYDTLVQEVNNELGSTATFEQREEALQRKVLQHPELKELLDVSGKLDYNKFCAFVVVDGLASDLNFTFKSKDGRDISESPNPLILKTDDEADQKYFDSVTLEKLNDGLFKNVFGLGINEDILYKSTVFIPINTNNRLSGVLFSGQKLKDSTALGLLLEYQTSLGKQDLNSSNPLLLWQ